MDPEYVAERIKHFAPVVDARKLEQERLATEMHDLRNKYPEGGLEGNHMHADYASTFEEWQRREDETKLRELNRAYHLIDLHHEVDIKVGGMIVYEDILVGGMIEEKGPIISFDSLVCRGYYTKNEFYDEVCKYLESKSTENYAFGYEEYDLSGRYVEIVVWIEPK